MNAARREERKMCWWLWEEPGVGTGCFAWKSFKIDMPLYGCAIQQHHVGSVSSLPGGSIAWTLEKVQNLRSSERY